MSDTLGTETRQDLVVPQQNGTGGQPRKRRYDHNDIHLRKKSDTDAIGELGGVKTKGNFSPKYVEDNLVTGVCDALEKFNAKSLFRKQAATLEEVVSDIVTYPFVQARMSRVASVYQARNPEGGVHRVLLPLDPLDTDQVQADLAVVCAEVVRRIPDLVPDARGVYEAVCVGLGNRPPALASPAES